MAQTLEAKLKDEMGTLLYHCHALSAELEAAREYIAVLKEQANARAEADSKPEGA